MSQTVTLSGDNYSGKILVATYDGSDKLIDVRQYTPEETVTYDGSTDYAYARVMWWGGKSLMKPLTKDIVVKNQ